MRTKSRLIYSLAGQKALVGQKALSGRIIGVAAAAVV